MTSFAQTILLGIRQSFRARERKWLFLGIALLSFAVLFSIPVFSFPGNSYTFQISITRWSDVALLLALSGALGLVAVLQLECCRCCGACESKVASAIKGGSSVFAVLTGGLFATAACSSCVVGFLGLVGISTSVGFLLLDYRWYIVWGALLMTTVFIVLTARKAAQGSCTTPSHR